MSDVAFETVPRQCLRGTWSIAQMRKAFDKVAPKGNWKLPIRAEVPVARIDVTLDAIEWFCGGRAQVAAASDRSAIVIHPGYYVAVGA